MLLRDRRSARKERLTARIIKSVLFWIAAFSLGCDDASIEIVSPSHGSAVRESFRVEVEAKDIRQVGWKVRINGRLFPVTISGDSRYVLELASPLNAFFPIRAEILDENGSVRAKDRITTLVGNLVPEDQAIRDAFTFYVSPSAIENTLEPALETALQERKACLLDGIFTGRFNSTEVHCVFENVEPNVDFPNFDGPTLDLQAMPTGLEITTDFENVFFYFKSGVCVAATWSVEKMSVSNVYDLEASHSPFPPIDVDSQGLSSVIYTETSRPHRYKPELRGYGYAIQAPWNCNPNCLQGAPWPSYEALHSVFKRSLDEWLTPIFDSEAALAPECQGVIGHSINQLFASATRAQWSTETGIELSSTLQNMHMVAVGIEQAGIEFNVGANTRNLQTPSDPDAPRLDQSYGSPQNLPPQFGAHTPTGKTYHYAYSISSDFINRALMSAAEGGDFDFKIAGPENENGAWRPQDLSGLFQAPENSTLFEVRSAASLAPILDLNERGQGASEGLLRFSHLLLRVTDLANQNRTATFVADAHFPVFFTVDANSQALALDVREPSDQRIQWELLETSGGLAIQDSFAFAPAVRAFADQVVTQLRDAAGRIRMPGIFDHPIMPTELARQTGNMVLYGCDFLYSEQNPKLGIALAPCEAEFKTEINSELSINLAAIHPDSNASLHLTVTPLPGGSETLYWDSQTRRGRMQWFPEPRDIGTHNLQFQVCDGGGACAKTQIRVVVEAPDGDAPPFLNPPRRTSDENVQPGERASFTITGDSADGDPLLFSALYREESASEKRPLRELGASFTQSWGKSAEFNWVPSQAHLGRGYIIYVTVTENTANQLSAVRTVYFCVTDQPQSRYCL